MDSDARPCWAHFRARTVARATHPAVADHDQIGTDVGGDADERVGRVRVHDMDLDGHALTSSVRSGMFANLLALERDASVHLFDVHHGRSRAGGHGDVPEQDLAAPVDDVQRRGRQSCERGGPVHGHAR